MITIIVPVHNTKPYLEKCLDSIKKQTYKDIEVLCIDSSNDGSIDIIKMFVTEDKRFKLIEDRNTSYGYKINLGISKAKGNYIGIVDSDDYIGTRTYEKAYEAIKKYKVDFVKYDYYSFSTNPKKYRRYTRNTLNRVFYKEVFNSKKHSDIFYDSNIAIWAGLYRKKFLLDNGIKLNETPGASFQDTGFFILTTLYAKRVIYIKEAYYNYRRSSINASSKSNKNVYSIINEFDYILGEINKKKDLSVEQYEAIVCRKLFTYSWNYLRLEKQLADKFEKRIRKELKNVYHTNAYQKMPTRIVNYINDSGILNNIC